MITDRYPQTCEAFRSLLHAARRFRPRFSSPVALALAAALLAPAPASAVIGTGIAEIQEEQVERFLQRVVDETGGDRVWTWDSMIHSCTTTLMRGSPEQDPEQSRVRFTPDAQRFLTQCALVKGFRERTSSNDGPAMVEPTLERRIDILGKILAEWVSDTSSNGMTVARRNEECARWITTKSEWKQMLAKNGGLSDSPDGVSARVKMLVGVCGKSKGFDVRPEKLGAPLQALVEAARAEIEAAMGQ